MRYDSVGIIREKLKWGILAHSRVQTGEEAKALNRKEKKEEKENAFLFIFEKELAWLRHIDTQTRSS
jgi:hypothetical protein